MNRARWDLCGGHRVTVVPTAILDPKLTAANGSFEEVEFTILALTCIDVHSNVRTRKFDGNQHLG